MRIEYGRVLYWHQQVKAFEQRCRAAGKRRTTAAGGTMLERDMAQAVECAVVEVLGGEPDLIVRAGDDGKVDGTVLGMSYDVKCSLVRSNWDGPQGWNDPDSVDGRVVADLMVGSLLFEIERRCEALGYNRRDDPMRRISGFSRPAYPRSGLRPMSDLLVVEQQPYWLCARCLERYPKPGVALCAWCSLGEERAR